MKIKDNEYGFSVFPNSNKVKAEIFKVIVINKTSFNIHMISKDFGSMFRDVSEIDYIKARAWVDEQMRCIFNANKE